MARMATAFANQLSNKMAPATPHVHWLPRLGLAAIFLYHGVDKLRAGTPPQEALDAMFLGSGLVFWLVALAETAAGAAILAGGLKHDYADLLTRFAGFAIAVVMLGAAFIVHLPEWHFMRGGAEFQILTAAVGVLFLVRGNK